MRSAECSTGSLPHSPNAPGVPKGARMDVSAARPDPARSVVAAAHQAVVDLLPVVVFGLKPEHRHAGHAAFARQLARRRDRPGGLVDGERGAREEAHLLAGRDGGGACGT